MWRDDLHGWRVAVSVKIAILYVQYMWKYRLWAFFLLLLSTGVGFFIYATEPRFSGNEDTRFPFKLGLDLSGGTHLVYRADLKNVAGDEVDAAMESLRDVIERRVNLFGVTEPLVQRESGGLVGVEEERLIVELPGVSEIDEAVKLIGATPVLQFKIERPNGETQKIIEAQLEGKRLTEDPYLPTSLTGRYLKRAVLEFAGSSGQQGFANTPVVSLEFTDEGGKLFAEITAKNVGKVVAIYLDGAPISQPVVQEEITGGKAQITGNFTPEEGKQLVGRLNAGALPVPIELLSSQTIGPSLGAAALSAGIKAGVIGLLAVFAFMTIWYRVPGLIAAVALIIYAVMNLALFKLIGVTLTAAGIAGFILSIGMAVDGNVLIFERMKEELRAGKKLRDAIHDGFDRAWAAIWDGNVTAIVSAIILFWFGTSLVEGFALTFGLGVLLSMISSITVSRALLLAIAPKENSSLSKFFFGSGISASPLEASRYKL